MKMRCKLASIQKKNSSQAEFVFCQVLLMLKCCIPIINKGTRGDDDQGAEEREAAGSHHSRMLTLESKARKTEPQIQSHYTLTQSERL